MVSVVLGYVVDMCHRVCGVVSLWCQGYVVDTWSVWCYKGYVGRSIHGVCSCILHDNVHAHMCRHRVLICAHVCVTGC